MVVKDRMTPEKEQRGAPNTEEGIRCVVSQFLLGFSLLSIVLSSLVSISEETQTKQNVWVQNNLH